MPSDRISLPKARGAALDLALEVQAERVIVAILKELYVHDPDRELFRWGRDVSYEEVGKLIDKITQKVVYGR